MPVWLQKIVSGKRNRFIDGEEKINLDLSYITDKVVAMSYPAFEYKEKLYRNNIDDVAKFFNNNHPDSYMIFNMSNRLVKAEKFNHCVQSYSWEDHHSPALSLLF